MPAKKQAAQKPAKKAPAKKSPSAKKKPAPAAVAEGAPKKVSAKGSGKIPVQRPAAAVCQAADRDFSLGRWRSAVAGYAGVVVACPTALRPRLRTADALLNLGHRREALEVYRATVAQATAAGAPLIALVAQKIAALLDPKSDDAASAIAERYAHDSRFIDDQRVIAPLPPLDDEVLAVPLSQNDQLTAAATAIATRPPKSDKTSALPPVPLLSYLDEDDFIRALDLLRLRRFSAGEQIIRQGERSESVFIIADGDVLLTRNSASNSEEEDDVVLARLRTGAVFGELALISDEPRQASAVAVGDVDVLELRRSDLIVASARTPSLSEALRQFTRERFLRNLTATHPFFSPLGRPERHRVMEQTRVLTFTAGDTLIQEKQRGPGLFMLLGGAVSVKKSLPQKPDAPLEYIHLATLRGGDLCGEMSLLTDAPTNATVTCTTDLEALFLSRDAFKAVTAEHPELLRYLAGLTDERLRKNRALLHGKSVLEDDEHVMI